MLNVAKLVELEATLEVSPTITYLEEAIIELAFGLNEMSREEILTLGNDVIRYYADKILELRKTVDYDYNTLDVYENTRSKVLYTINNTLHSRG